MLLDKKKEALSCLWVSPSTSQHAFYFSIHLIISAFYSPPIYDPKQALTRKMTSYRLFSGVQCSKITRRPAKGKTGGTCFFATVFPRWSCGGSCVIGDLINRWICCIAIPGRELLPEQPHHKHCRLMVGNYDLLVATCALWALSGGSTMWAVASFIHHKGRRKSSRWILQIGKYKKKKNIIHLYLDALQLYGIIQNVNLD